MTEKTNTQHSQDPSQIVGNIAGFRDVDLHSSEVVEALKERGGLFRRKIEPVKGVRDPRAAEKVDTVVTVLLSQARLQNQVNTRLLQALGVKSLYSLTQNMTVCTRWTKMAPLLPVKDAF